MLRKKLPDKRALETLRKSLASNPKDLDAANRYWSALASFQSGHYVVEAFRPAALASDEGVVAFAHAYRGLFETSGERPRAVFFDKQLIQALEDSGPKLPEKERSIVEWILDSIRGQQKNIKFPERRSDGSFCVEVAFRVDLSELESFISRVTAWLDEWVKTNRYWKPGFSHREARDETFDFLRDFAVARLCFTPAPNLVCLRLEGQPESNRAWKDWLCMKLISELRGSFPEIKSIESIRNCSDALRETK